MIDNQPYKIITLAALKKSENFNIILPKAIKWKWNSSPLIGLENLAAIQMFSPRF